MSALRIGTRGSALALAQAGWVAEQLGGELVVLRTSGDEGASGDKARWVDTIEAALVAGEIDLAVHSAKDVPGELAPGTAIVATPVREDPRDLRRLHGPAGPLVRGLALALVPRCCELQRHAHTLGQRFAARRAIGRSA